MEASSLSEAHYFPSSGFLEMKTASPPSRDSRVAGGRSPAGEEAAVVVVVTLAQSEYSELNLLSHVVLPESFFFHFPSQLAQPHDRRL